MIDGIQNLFKIPELKKRIFYTFGLLAVYRVGAFIPTPGIDGQALGRYFESVQGTILGFFNMFSGGALEQMAVFALGIMPYISASIILELLTVVVPYLEKLKKEGEAGRKKINQYTRYGTVVLSMVQGLGIAIGLEHMEIGGAIIVPNAGWSFRLMTMITLTAGTTFIMWLGEQITERGIGNGISLIIFSGIVAQMPSAIGHTWTQLRLGEMSPFLFLGILVLMVAVVAAIVFMEAGHRRIPIQYAKRVVGRRMYGGQSTHLPLKINTSGVIPPIFASSIMVFPATIAQFLGGNNPDGILGTIVQQLSPGTILYSLLTIVMIIFFAYFYTAIIFNPADVADNMRKYGGFVPGIRPGKKTAEYIDRTLSRLTLVGALYLSFIVILPTYLVQFFHVPFFFGGTGLLIVVGVAMDTMQQVESHLVMRHYESFMKKGRIKGRR
ncbi:MAG: preprotein translocase subunit SecY [Candidatus Tectomicrobia bacterium]|uniref:Protein translocase subunit SecY n=1 Tax=Tectimicrobiota bacterium TaxID=2528274 RepID=A0A938B626_UNCTE|nr:preprotein translocase subunit SecY [Candidatus Tectomicrobia bacterium]